MSTRAYKIIKKEVESNPSFNLWHDNDLMDFFEDNGADFWLGDCTTRGASISVETIKLALANKKLWHDEDSRVSQLSKDIEGLDDDDYIEYECY